MSLRAHQPPAPARAPAAPTTIEAAWQALCTHPADAPLVHVDHSHRFHTPADTDGLLKLKKVQLPDPMTTVEEVFLKEAKAFLDNPSQNYNSFQEMLEVKNKVQNAMPDQKHTSAFIDALGKALAAKKKGAYNEDQQVLFASLEHIVKSEKMQTHMRQQTPENKTKTKKVHVSDSKPEMTETEREFIGVLSKFIQSPGAHEKAMDDAITAMVKEAHYTQRFKDEVHHELFKKDHGMVSYTESQVNLFIRIEKKLQLQ